jgi:hypothetical protein
MRSRSGVCTRPGSLWVFHGAEDSIVPKRFILDQIADPERAIHRPRIWRSPPPGSLEHEHR